LKRQNDLIVNGNIELNKKNKEQGQYYYCRYKDKNDCKEKDTV